MSENEKKLGRPTDYRPEYDQLAYNYALLGATMEKIAKNFDCSVDALERWSEKYPSFRGALRRGRDEADSEVARALYRCAVGYTKKVQRVVVADGVPTVVTLEEEVGPNDGAAARWLGCRMVKDPDSVWSNNRKIEVTTETADGDSVGVAVIKKIVIGDV